MKFRLMALLITVMMMCGMISPVYAQEAAESIIFEEAAIELNDKTEDTEDAAAVNNKADVNTNALEIESFSEETAETEEAIVSTEERSESEEGSVLTEETAETEEASDPSVETSETEDVIASTEATSEAEELPLPSEEATEIESAEDNEENSDEDEEQLPDAEFLSNVDSGTCGNNVYWVLDSTGLLRIMGSGPMDDNPAYQSDFYGHDILDLITSVKIQSGITSIGDAAFFYCTNLVSVEIPNSVTSIGGAAFQYCTSLTSVQMPDSLSYMGNAVFMECNNLTSCIIPNGLTEIPGCTFDYCYALKNVTIPRSVKYIGSWAFEDCGKLEYINYLGSSSEYSQIDVSSAGNDCFIKAPFYCAIISLNTPTTTAVRVLNGISVSWTADINARGYEVYRKADNESTYSKVVTSLSTSWTDTNVSNNMAYRYMVRGYRTEADGSVTKGSFSPSSQAGFITQVKGASAVNTNTGVKISWTAINGTRGYQIYRKTSSESSYQRVATSLSTSWTDTSVSNNTSFSYMVRAYNVANDGYVYSGAFSAALNIVFVKSNSIPVVQNLSLSRLVNGIKISWSAASGINGYQVYRKAENESSYSRIAVVTSESYTDTSVKNNTMYRYMVRAYKLDSKGNTVTGEFCSSQGMGYISQPKNFQLIKDYNGIEMSWSAIAGVRGYQIYRRADGESSYSCVYTTISTGWTDTSAVANKGYSYMVRAYNKAGDGTVYYGTFSPALTGGYIPQIKNVTAVSQENGIKISWTGVSGTRGYHVYRKSSNESTYSQITASAATSYTDQTAVNGVTYSYMIRGYNKAADNTVYSGAFSASISCKKMSANDIWNDFIQSGDYKQAVNLNETNFSGYSYATYDLDRDGTLELIIRGPSEAVGAQAYVFDTDGQRIMRIMDGYNIGYNAANNYVSCGVISGIHGWYSVYRIVGNYSTFICTHYFETNLATGETTYGYMDDNGNTYNNTYDKYGYNANKSIYLGDTTFNWKAMP